MNFWNSIMTWAGANWVALVSTAVGVYVIAPAAAWVASWLNGKGADLVRAELVTLQKKINENTLMGQIHADDAVLGILEDAIPDAMHTLGSAVQAEIATGKISATDWAACGKTLWVHAQAQIRGGVHDYFANSSFVGQDEEILAGTVFKRFFLKQSLTQSGVIKTNPTPTDAVTVSHAVATPTLTGVSVETTAVASSGVTK